MEQMSFASTGFKLVAKRTRTRDAPLNFRTR
jgi:hypothetical protein